VQQCFGQTRTIWTPPGDGQLTKAPFAQRPVVADRVVELNPHSLDDRLALAQTA